MAHVDYILALCFLEVCFQKLLLLWNVCLYCNGVMLSPDSCFHVCTCLPQLILVTFHIAFVGLVIVVYCEMFLCLRSKGKVGNLSRPLSFTLRRGLITVCLTMPRLFLGSTVGSNPNTSHPEVLSWSTAVLVWDAQALTLPLIMSSIRSQPRVLSIFPGPLSELATRGWKWSRLG